MKHYKYIDPNVFYLYEMYGRKAIEDGCSVKDIVKRINLLTAKLWYITQDLPENHENKSRFVDLYRVYTTVQYVLYSFYTREHKKS